MLLFTQSGHRGEGTALLPEVIQGLGFLLALPFFLFCLLWSVLHTRIISAVSPVPLLQEFPVIDKIGDKQIPSKEVTGVFTHRL